MAFHPDIALRSPQFVAAGIGLVALAVALTSLEGPLRLLFAVGLLLGATLYHGAFGFAAAYRSLLTGRGADGALAQIVMLAVATLLFAPVLAEGSFFGRGVIGAVAPFGIAVAVGAFLFGIGMQLAGACASGCLYTAGGGNVRTLITLTAFCAGAFLGSLHLGWWLRLPSAGDLSLSGLLGWPLAVAIQIGLFAALALVLRRLAGARLAWRLPRGPEWLAGPWPLSFSAVVLAVLNLATLAISGHPWTVTWAFALWGAKAAQGLGWDPATSDFWSAPFQSHALAGDLWRDETTVMDVGLLAGAFLAAGAAGRFRPVFSIPPLSIASALLGGLAMGYGARLSFGCNIGAFFSGVASTSLHGWLWIVMALGGTWVGVKLRPLFGLRG